MMLNIKGSLKTFFKYSLFAGSRVMAMSIRLGTVFENSISQGIEKTASIVNIEKYQVIAIRPMK